MSARTCRPGPLVVILLVVLFGLPGIVWLAGGALYGSYPADWVDPQFRTPLGRARSAAIGLGLISLGWGIFTRARWAWIGYVAWTVAALYHTATTAFVPPATIQLYGFGYLMPLGLPYLWARRRDFDIARPAATEPG